MAKASDRCATPFKHIDTDNIRGMTNVGVFCVVRPVATTATLPAADALTPDAVTPETATTPRVATDEIDAASISAIDGDDDKEGGFEIDSDNLSATAIDGDRGDDREGDFEIDTDGLSTLVVIGDGDDREPEFTQENTTEDQDDIAVRLEDFVGFPELAGATQPFTYDFDTHMQTAMLGAVMAFTACHY